MDKNVTGFSTLLEPRYSLLQWPRRQTVLDAETAALQFLAETWRCYSGKSDETSRWRLGLRLHQLRKIIGASGEGCVIPLQRRDDCAVFRDTGGEVVDRRDARERRFSLVKFCEQGRGLDAKNCVRFARTIFCGQSSRRRRDWPRRSSALRFRVKAVWAVGENAPLLRNDSTAALLAPIASRLLRFIILRSDGSFVANKSSRLPATLVTVSAAPTPPPIGMVASWKVAPPANAAQAIPSSSFCRTALLL